MKTISKVIFSGIFMGVIGMLMYIKVKGKTGTTEDTSFPRREDLKTIKTLSGIILPRREVVLKSEISGIIVKLYVRPGELVRAGDSIARIKLIADPTSLENAEKQAHLDEINYNEAEKKYNRQKSLYNSGVLPLAEFEAVEKELLYAREMKESNLKQLEIVKYGFAYGRSNISDIIYSTIDGVVLELPLKEGSNVIETNPYNEGSAVAIIADMQEMIFNTRVNENDIKYLQPNMKFKVFVPAISHNSFDAILTNISAKATEDAGMMKFEIEGSISVPISKINNLRSGYTATAEIILEEVKSAITIDEKYIHYKGDSTYVYVFMQGKHTKRAIITGASNGLRTEIKQGLKLNERVLNKEEP